MGLVDHHALESHLSNPVEVAIEHLVVNDDHVGERIHVLSIAVNHGGATAGDPALNLARPVHFHNVRHHR